MRVQEFREQLYRTMDPQRVVDTLREILDTGDNKERLKAIEVYLDRMYGKPQQSVDVTSDGQPVLSRRPEEYSDEELLLMLEKAKKAK